MRRPVCAFYPPSQHCLFTKKICRRARLKALYTSLCIYLDMLPIRHHSLFTRRIEGTTRSSFIFLTVPSISPYKKMHTPCLVLQRAVIPWTNLKSTLKARQSARRARLEAPHTLSRRDLSVLPIRHRGVINSQHALNIHHRRAVDCLHITQERMLFEHAASNYGFKTCQGNLEMS